MLGQPLWAVLEDTGLVLAFHAFTNSEDEYPEDGGDEEGYGGALDFMTMRMADGQHPVLQLLLSGSLVNLTDKAPIEGRGLCSWAPLLLGR